MTNEERLEDLKQRREMIQQQVIEAQEKAQEAQNLLNQLVVVRTKVEGAMEHKQFEIDEEEKESKNGSAPPEKEEKKSKK